jgi:hypothetical protein
VFFFCFLLAFSPLHIYIVGKAYVSAFLLLLLFWMHKCAQAGCSCKYNPCMEPQVSRHRFTGTTDIAKKLCDREIERSRSAVAGFQYNLWHHQYSLSHKVGARYLLHCYFAGESQVSSRTNFSDNLRQDNNPQGKGGNALKGEPTSINVSHAKLQTQWTLRSDLLAF